MKQKKGRPTEIVYPTISRLSALSFKRFSETLFQKGVVVIPNIGRFELRRIKDRRAYHNKAKKVITMKGRERVHFVAIGKLEKLCK